MRRIERLINLIAALLETARPMTAAEIREKIAGYDQDTHQAFRRAFERDKEALRSMGVPVETVEPEGLDEHAFAYFIPKNRYYLPELDLEDDELAALRIAAEAVLGAGEQAEVGLLKLSIDAPSEPWMGPRVVWGADLAAEQPLLPSLYQALLERRSVTFAYRAGSSDEPETRTVEPYSLVHRRGHWYLVGRDPSRAAIRSFRVARIAELSDATGSRYEIPEGFDAGAQVSGQAWELGEEQMRALVRFDASLRWWAEQNLRELPKQEGPRGSLEVEMKVANLDAFVSWALGFGDAVELVSPPEARRRLIDHLAPLLEAG